MEAKSYGVPSASWRPRRAGGMVQSMSEGENQEHRGPRAGEDGCPSSNRVNSPSLALFVLFSPSKIWMMSTHTGEGDLLYSVYPFKC